MRNEIEGLIKNNTTNYEGYLAIANEFQKLEQENKMMREWVESVLNNYEKCPQNPHNPPTLGWKYLKQGVEIMNKLTKDKE